MFKNQLKKIGKGFSFEKNLFGVSINSCYVSKFVKKQTGEIAICLRRGNEIFKDEPVYRFKDSESFSEWKDHIYDGLHYQDGSLLVRAYPDFFKSWTTNAEEE